ncbi:MAG: glycosyltransferase family 1 protein, partial [bacterium]|nr:glycosyltransferase family 1 protein [bacterium]
LSRWPLWSQVRLAERIVRDRPDVVFIPAHVIPFALTLLPRRARPRLVTTIHDVVFKRFPEAYSPRERWYADRATALAVRHADAIIVPTAHVGGELVEWYGCDRRKVYAIHHGVEQGVGDTGSGDGAPYILYIGRLERKKNVVRIVQAWSAIAQEHSTLQLVLAGSDGHGAEDVHAAIAASPYRARISTPGWIDQDRYRALLGRAAVFCFPTLGEGFGMPILEAMAAGTPVVTSRGGAHEEVSGDAAILVNPQDADAIAHGLRQALARTTTITALTERARARASGFTWSSTAEQTWSVLTDCT